MEKIPEHEGLNEWTLNKGFIRNTIIEGGIWEERFWLDNLYDI